MKKVTTLLASGLLLTSIASCGSKVNGVELSKSKPVFQTEDHSNNYIDDIYKNYYQVLVYSYFDSNNDKIGDLNGLTSKLDYINDGNKQSLTSLGYDGLYLLPIFPSPTYHKYDTTDYYNIDPSYGTLDDFDNLVSEANKRGIDIILDLALNHTSNQHPWFTKAKKATQYLSDYNLDTGEPTEEDKNRYPELRYYHIVHKDMISLYRGTNWYSIAGTDWMFEGSFYDGMPDLNLDEDVVKNEIKNIFKFWIDRGVSGFRLDAVEHFFDWNKEKNYELLNQLVQYGKDLTEGKGIYLVAEGPWSNTASKYYENTNDISYMNFNYGSGGQNKLATAINNSSLYNNKLDDLAKKKEEVIYSKPSGNNTKQFDIINNGAEVRCAADYFRAIVENWDELLYTANPNAVDANFGVNHDTLRAINNFSAKFQGDDLQNACKFYWGLNNTLSGVTFNYYGEEIGMRAGNPSIEEHKDPDKRHPMYWSEDNLEGIPNYAPGGTKVEQYLEPADKQMKDEDSLWNFMRELNRAKSYFPEITRGRQKFIKIAPTYVVLEKTYLDSKIHLLYNFSNKASKISLNELGLEEGITEIKYSLSSSSSYYSKLTADSLNVPAYSITIF